MNDLNRQIQQIFLTESEALIHELEICIGYFEYGRLDEQKFLQRGLCLAHNLKGMSQAAGVKTLSQTMHLIESDIQNKDQKNFLNHLGKAKKLVHSLKMDFCEELDKQNNYFFEMTNGLVQNLQKELKKEVLFKTQFDISFDELGAEKQNLLLQVAVQLLKNAIDHGIENSEQRKLLKKPLKGLVQLQLYKEENFFVVEVTDDGAGFDFEKMKSKKQVFEMGFSTRESACQTSGRGAGLYIVKTHVEKLGGSVDIHSVKLQGTQIKIKI